MQLINIVNIRHSNRFDDNKCHLFNMYAIYINYYCKKLFNFILIFNLLNLNSSYIFNIDITQFTIMFKIIN